MGIIQDTLAAQGAQVVDKGTVPANGWSRTSSC
jgi:hypothetical protein